MTVVADSDSVDTLRVPVELTVHLARTRGHRARGDGRTRSIWPHVERQVVDLVTAHRSTIVFVKPRRPAERLTARLNEIHAEDTGPGRCRSHRPPPAQIMVPSGHARGATTWRWHHGSVSGERRAMIETRSRAASVWWWPPVAGTGHDMGAVDRVQVETPLWWHRAAADRARGTSGEICGSLKHRADLSTAR